MLNKWIKDKKRSLIFDWLFITLNIKNHLDLSRQNVFAKRCS